MLFQRFSRFSNFHFSIDRDIQLQQSQDWNAKGSAAAVECKKKPAKEKTMQKNAAAV